LVKVYLGHIGGNIREQTKMIDMVMGIDNVFYGQVVGRSLMEQQAMIRRGIDEEPFLRLLICNQIGEVLEIAHFKLSYQHWSFSRR
jgi:hypothetical protein